MWKATKVSGFGRVRPAEVLAARPERLRDLRAALREAAAAEDWGAGLIARGGGRSYGDAAQSDGGRVVLTERLDRLLAFDGTSGVLVAEAGVTFKDLLEVFLPRGFAAPVSPGTGYATLGGALACDVHGKNHEAAGSFGRHVQWFDLMLADGEMRRVSPESDPELFAATIGGMGLTGIVVQLALRLEPVASAWLRVADQRVPDLDAFLAALAAADAPFSVGWIDAQARGRELGRGILQKAWPAAGERRPHVSRRPRRVPFDLPGSVLRPATVRAFNALYRRRVPAAGRERAVPLADFLYPLDGLLDWNRLYGRRGFYQFQCVLPQASGAHGLARLLETITAAGGSSFLAVLKTLGEEGPGHLSFPLPGPTLALDFPRAPGNEELLRRLETITRDHGGRIYLAKDALLSADGLAAMYPALPRFRATLARLPASARLASDMARRLALVEVP